MSCHIGLQATTTEISSYMIYQSYWKMYPWQSEHECDMCMVVLWHILAVLCEMFSVTPIMSGYGGPWWDVSRRALNLMEDILSTYYECTLSIVSPHMPTFSVSLLDTHLNFILSHVVPLLCNDREEEHALLGNGSVNTFPRKRDAHSKRGCFLLGPTQGYIARSSLGNNL
jgi:hypothetical protein